MLSLEKCFKKYLSRRRRLIKVAPTGSSKNNIFVSSVDKLAEGFIMKQQQQHLKTKNFLQGTVVVVKWSACSPSTLTIRVRIPLKYAVFIRKIV